MAATERADVWNAGVAAMSDIGAGCVIGCVVTLAQDCEVNVVAATWPQCVGMDVVVTTPDVRRDERLVVLDNGETVGATPSSTMWTQPSRTQLLPAVPAVSPLHSRSRRM